MLNFKHPRYRWLLPITLASFSPLGAAAQATDVSDTAATGHLQLDPLVISATRNKSSADETPRRTTIITREQIEQQLAITQDPGAVLGQLIPSYSPSRQKLSNAGETFRGRSPLFMIDGVPQSNPLRDGGRDSYTIDLSMVERIEVIHGASAEHGLGATGGIINFITKRPEGGRINQHIGIRLTSDDNFDSEGFGHKLNYRISGLSGNWDYLVAASYQQRGLFYDSNSKVIGIAYPGEIQNSKSHDLLAKVGYWLDDNQNINFTINRFVLEGEGGYVPVPGDRDAGIPTTARQGDHLGDPGYNEVTMANLSYSHGDWLGNKIDIQLYTQRFRAQFATTPYFPYLDGSGNTRYDQTRNESDKIGAKFTISRDGLLNNRLGLTTGLDLLQSKTRQMLVHTGRTYVPETRFQNYALFLQGDYSLTDDLSLHAGVRYEQAELKVDDYSTIDRSNVTQDEVAVGGGSPNYNETLYNAGVTYQVTPWAQLYASYSEGFGMTDVGRVLRAIDTPGLNVETLIELRPILTDNREIGARFDWDRYHLELSYYQSNSDLGERLVFNGSNWVGSREKTEIRGFEITGEAQINDAHRVSASYTHAEGKSDTDDDGAVDTKLTGLNIAPDVLRLAWSATWSDKLSTQLQFSHYFDRSIGDPTLEFDGYSLIDVSLIYRLPVGSASLGIANLTNEDYFTYYSQAGRASDDYYFKGRGRTLTLGYQLDF